MHFTTLFLSLVGLSSAHFVLNWPPPPGAFDEDQEPNAPCGGQVVTVDNSSTPLNVDRFAVSIRVTHPTGEFGFRFSENTTAPYNFTDITRVINSTNPGTFCANYISAPSSLVGKSGILQVIDNSIDGILYQCAAVQFVSGANETAGSACTNTSTSIQWAAEDDTFASNATSTTATTAAVSATAGSTAAASSSKPGIAPMVTLGLGHLAGGLGAIAAGILV